MWLRYLCKISLLRVKVKPLSISEKTTKRLSGSQRRPRRRETMRSMRGSRAGES